MTYLPQYAKKLKNDRFISQIFFKKIVTTENLLPHMPLLQDIAACLIIQTIQVYLMVFCLQ